MTKPIKPKSLLLADLTYHFRCWSCGGEQWHWFPEGTRLPVVIYCRLCSRPNQLPESGLVPEHEVDPTERSHLALCKTVEESEEPE